MSIKKTLTGIVLAGALAFGCRANAQTKLSTETQIIDNKVGLGLPLQRTTIESKPLTLKYDKTSAMGNNADPADVGAIFIDDIALGNNTTGGAYIMNCGNFDGKDEIFPGIWVKKKFNDIIATLEAGKGVRSTGSPREYAIFYFRSPTISGDAAYFAQGSTFGKNDIWKYGWLTYHDKYIYAGAGRNVKKNLGFLGLKGFDDFGTFTYAMRDEVTGNVNIRSQTAAGNVNKFFFNNGLFDIAANYLTLPAFFTKHFSPLSTKGNVSLKLEYKRVPSAGTEEKEILVGTNQLPIQISLGINSEKKNNHSVSGFVTELYKEFSIAGIKGDVEIRYNSRAKDLQAYVKAGYEF